MIKWVIISTYLLTNAATAQIILDEAQNVESTLAKQIAADVAEHFSDPLAVQVRRLHPLITRDGVICGEVNAKNLYGGYVGFEPFRYMVKTRKVYLVNSRC